MNLDVTDDMLKEIESSENHGIEESESASAYSNAQESEFTGKFGGMTGMHDEFKALIFHDLEEEKKVHRDIVSLKVAKRKSDMNQVK